MVGEGSGEFGFRLVGFLGFVTHDFLRLLWAYIVLDLVFGFEPWNAPDVLVLEES